MLMKWGKFQDGYFEGPHISEHMFCSKIEQFENFRWENPPQFLDTIAEGIKTQQVNTVMMISLVYSVTRLSFSFTTSSTRSVKKPSPSCATLWRTL